MPLLDPGSNIKELQAAQNKVLSLVDLLLILLGVLESTSTVRYVS